MSRRVGGDGMWFLGLFRAGSRENSPKSSPNQAWRVAFSQMSLSQGLPPQEVVPIPQTESFAEYLAIPEVVNG